MKLPVETVLEARTACLDNAVSTVCDKHRGQRTDIKIYGSEILTLATEFERWFVRGLDKSSGADPQPVGKARQSNVEQVHPEPLAKSSPLEDKIDAQRDTRKQFEEDFSIDKFAAGKGEKKAVQKGLGFSLKK